MIADSVLEIWTDSAKSLTLQAAETAGFGSKITLQLMSEPDAAAAWTLLRDLKLTNLKVRYIGIPSGFASWANTSYQVLDAFVVVDCGGGTVVSYTPITKPLILRPLLYA